MSKEPSASIFRREALDQLSSPEQLDQLLQVVSRKSWLPILGVAAILVLALIWSVAGTIPVTVQGEGQLHYEESLVTIHSPASGQIAALSLRVDEVIAANQQVGEIDQPHLRQRLEQEVVRRNELENRYVELLALRTRRRNDEKALFVKNRERLVKQIESTSERASTLRGRSAHYFEELEKTLAHATRDRNALGKNYEARLSDVLNLIAQGHAEPSEELDARRDVMENKAASDDLQLRIHQIELKRLESSALYERQMERLGELESSMQTLAVEEEKSETLYQEFILDSQLGISEAERSIKRIEEQLATEGRVTSPYKGRVLEVTGTSGQFVEKGQRLATICVEQIDGRLLAYAYFELRDGKRIDVGQIAHVTPTTVKRERFGSILGRVRSVAEYPVTTAAVATTVGNAEVAQRLTAGGDKIAVTVELLPSAGDDGYEWTSGNKVVMDISAGLNVSVRASVEERPPISFVIPIVRQWMGS